MAQPITDYRVVTCEIKPELADTESPSITQFQLDVGDLLDLGFEPWEGLFFHPNAFSKYGNPIFIQCMIKRGP